MKDDLSPVEDNTPDSEILIIWGRNKSMSFIELVDSIESSLGFPVQRFHELCSTRVTRVYELARGRVDSRGFAGRADVQGFSRWLAPRVIPWLETIP